VTLCTPHYQCRARIPHLFWIFVGKVTETAQCGRQVLEGDFEFLYAIISAHEVCQEELPDWDTLLVWLEDFIGFFQSFHFRIFNLSHAHDVFGEIGFERGIYRRIVDGYDRANTDLLPQRDGHNDLGAHGVTNEARVFDLMVAQEELEVFRERGIVVCRMVGGVAVVPCIDCENGSLQVAHKDPVMCKQQANLWTSNW
jgi:hypothetical protein